MEKEIKNKKKICFFSPASYPFFEEDSSVPHGGAELQMFLLASFMANEKKYKTCFFVGNYGKKPNKKGIEFILSFKNKKRENTIFKIYKAAKYFLQLIKTQPDIIISTTANAYVGINAFYAKLLNKRFIYRTAHLIDVNGTYINTRGLSGKLYKYGLTHANKVITQNYEHKEQLKKHHKIQSTVLKNAINIKATQTIKKDIVLWVGRFESWKQPKLFLDIAKRIPDEKFIMICPFVENNKKKWDKMYKGAQKINNLTVFKKIAFNKIQNYFNRAKIFINTSESEGFPNTFLQAAIAKAPIASLNVNPDNFITKYDCGFFAENNFENMLKQIKFLLKDNNSLKIKGENLLQYLKENHDIEVVGKEFVNIVESL